MHTLFRDIGMHASLGRAIEQIGGNRFWKQLILLLRRTCRSTTPWRSSTRQRRAGGLEEYDAEPHAGPASMLAYLNGLYLLDPSTRLAGKAWPAACTASRRSPRTISGRASTTSATSTTTFWRTRCSSSYRCPAGSALSLSLGMQRMFADEECGMLGLLSSWVLALMQQHWQQRSQRLLPAAPQEEMATQIRDALSHFGASVLSERELEIARLILRGYSSKAMAERLAISPETIKVHRRHLYAKLDISSQPELFSLFIQSLGHDPENP